MKSNPGWTSFFPVLIKAVQKTTGPILELGSGPFSTPLLHWCCAESGRRLVTFEDKPEYYNLARRFRTDTHEVYFVKNWDRVRFDRADWDVVLADHGHVLGQRAKDILRLKDHAKYIVIHDTEEKLHGFDKIWPEFKYIYHWTFDRRHTSVVSNLTSLEIFKT